MNEALDDYLNRLKWLEFYHKEPNLQQYPLLFLLLLDYSNAQHWSSKPFRTVSQLEPQAFLKALDLPYTQENTWLLQHACQVDEDFDTPWAFETEELSSLYRFFKHNTVRQLDRSTIPQSISRLMFIVVITDQYPELIRARFIKLKQGKEVPRHDDLQILHSIHQLAQRLSMTHLNRRIRRCRDSHELRLLLYKLEHKAYDHILNDLAVVDLDDLDCVLACIDGWLEAFDREQLQAHWFDDYGASPLPGNAQLIPLRTYRSLFLEGLAQHNCATFHHDEMRDNEYLLFSLWAPERATLGLIYNEDKHGYDIDQLLLKDNMPVADATERKIKHWLKHTQQPKHLWSKN